MSFRNNRSLLPPEAFAHSEGPDLPPRDLIEENIWNSIMFTPDDVSLRTSADHGKEIKIMYELWSSFIEYSFKRGKSPLSDSILDACDELQNSMITLIIGLYGLSASCLRAVIEYGITGLYFSLIKKDEDYYNWRDKEKGKIEFDSWCGQITKNNTIISLEKYLQSKGSFSILKTKDIRQNYEGGWVRKLHDTLSNYSHSRPGYRNVDLWEGSNGPIYIPESFGFITAHYLDTSSLIYALIKISDNSLELPSTTSSLLFCPDILPSKLMMHTYSYLWGSDFQRLLNNDK